MEQDNNRYLIQSTNYTTMRNNWGLYAQRLMVRIAQAMQYRLEDASLYEPILQPNDPRLIWRFKVADLMTGTGQNYTQVRKQLEKLPKNTVEFENDKGQWIVCSIFPSIKGDDKTGEIVVKINDDLWGLFLELSKGFKKYQLNTALSLNSPYSLRLYQLLAGNQQPITYDLLWLKKMFGVERKYTLAKDFIKRVIVSAQEELNEKAEKSFIFKPVYTNKGKGRPQITAITFAVVDTHNNTNFETRAKEINRVYGDSTIPQEIRGFLMVAYNFTPQGIRANAPLLAEAYMQMRKPTLAEFLRDKRDQAQRAKNPQGWIINAIRGELETI